MLDVHCAVMHSSWTRDTETVISQSVLIIRVEKLLTCVTTIAMYILVIYHASPHKRTTHEYRASASIQSKSKILRFDFGLTTPPTFAARGETKPRIERRVVVIVVAVVDSKMCVYFCGAVHQMLLSICAIKSRFVLFETKKKVEWCFWTHVFDPVPPYHRTAPLDASRKLRRVVSADQCFLVSVRLNINKSTLSDVFLRGIV